MSIIFLSILVVLSIGFLSDLFLDLLNLNHIKPELPGYLKTKYDSAAYFKSQNYLKEHGFFGIVISLIGFVVLILVLLLGGFAWLNSLVDSVTSHPALAAMLFFGIIGLVTDLGGVPFKIYSIFVIEEKYGFNKTTPVTFILDKLKSWLIVFLIGAPLLTLIIWLYALTGKWFWLLTWIALSLFSLLFSFFYSTLIVPLFNKQEPLADGDLRSAIERMSHEAGFPFSKIFVINGSKRSTKANAYFAGFGSKRRIILYDTLINDLTTNQILAVLAHEIGHYKKKHIYSTMVFSILQTGIFLFLFSLVAGHPALASAINVDNPGFHISVLVFSLLFSPISLVTGLAFNHLSRRFEYQADAFAAQLGYREDLADALIGLSEKNLGNLTPHPAYVFIHYSHPPLLLRLKRFSK